MTLEEMFTKVQVAIMRSNVADWALFPGKEPYSTIGTLAVYRDTIRVKKLAPNWFRVDIVEVEEFGLATVLAYFDVPKTPGDCLFEKLERIVGKTRVIFSELHNISEDEMEAHLNAALDRLEN